MEERYMINDILAGVKAGLTTYQTAITEAENPELRKTMQQIRNNDETFQFEVFKLAETKGYYKPASKATQREVDTVKKSLVAQ